ncbi:hypothetical protein EV121DRAFT_288471 [Schizophyllum commune]
MNLSYRKHRRGKSRSGKGSAAELTLDQAEPESPGPVPPTTPGKENEAPARLRLILCPPAKAADANAGRDAGSNPTLGLDTADASLTRDPRPTAPDLSQSATSTSPPPLQPEAAIEDDDDLPEVPTASRLAIKPKPRRVGPSLEEDDEDEDSDDSEDEVPTYDIPVEVPYGDGTRRVKNITTKTSFKDFNTLIAERMGIPVIKCTGYGYIPSWLPKSSKPKPKSLEDDDDYTCMIQEVVDHYEESARKSKGKQGIKSFTITIVPMRDMKAASAKEMKGSKKKKSTVVEDSDADSSGEKSSAPSEAKLYREIERRHACDTCGDGIVCAVLDGGQHYRLTDVDKASWVNLCKKYQATVSEIPLQALGITNKSAEDQNRIRKKGSAAAASGPFESVMAALVGNLLANGLGHGALPAPPPPPPPPPHSSTHPADDGAAPAAHKRLADDDAIEIPNIPLLTWLMQLEQDPVRGRAKIAYSDYDFSFHSRGFHELSDIYGMSARDLSEAVPDLPIGHAKRLVDYIAEDYGSRVGSKRIKWV